ncbi:hypothetical protein BGZ99_003708 [Dissophora globulifera]|uniref:Trafficking protein particle complex subunit 13 n=1 Tax=Dissophora globulifera TaxID=979702 RepID=A0A9P6RM60_9FUNG|nr:hypothetical protein BGZ99_003708 [Dissophora globulifera]
MAAGGQDHQRESHLISLKVMRLSRPSLVTGHGVYFASPHATSSSAQSIPSGPTAATAAAASLGERPNMTSILTDALSDLSLSQLERVHPPSSAKLVQPASSLHIDAAAAAESSSPATESGSLSNTAAGYDDTLDMGDFGVSELLTMPASFGNIYLGETFTSYICANNESAHPVRDVILKADLQTSTLRFALSDTLATQRLQQAQQASSKSPTMDMPPPGSPSLAGGGRHIQLLESGKTNEMIVSHEIKELGIHILVCSIEYTTLDGQQKTFRKFYKFQVLNPLSVKTKVNHPSNSTTTTTVSSGPDGAHGGNGSGGSQVSNMGVSTGGVVLLEAMVQNMSGVTMWLERMRFEVADAFTARDLTVVIQDENDNNDHTTNADDGDGKKEIKAEENESVSIFGKHDYFAPNDVRQYLYVLTPKPGKELMARTTNVLGKLDILWRSQFGETGRLQTSQLTRKPAPLNEIAVQVVKIPERIRLEEIFSIEIVIKNQSLSDSTSTQQQQQQQHSNAPGQLSRHPSGSTLPGQPPALGGVLARPPAAFARGGVVPQNRDTTAQTVYQQQQQQQSNSSHDQNSMKLMLMGVKQKMGAILLSGPNSRQLGSVPAGGEVRVRLDWFPLTSGVQKIGGIRIVDIISGYTVELDYLTNCFVEHT